MTGLAHVTTPTHVPLVRPDTAAEEIDAVTDVLRSGNLAQGERVAEFETAFARYIGCSEAVATSSGTTALQLALLALGIGPGDEVITTSFTFIATVTSIVHAGATPVLADIDPHTLNLSPASVRARITSRTRAIMPVDLYGNPCDFDAFQALADEFGLAIIDDACQAHGAEYGGRRVGSSGTACFSFYPTKNMTSGEGGMICTSDPEVADRARLLRAHGMRQRYRHDLLGHNFRMTDVHAAIGLAQLRRLDHFNQARRDTAAFYDANLRGAKRPDTLPGARSAWHQYTLIVEPSRRDALVEHLTARGIGVAIYYPVPVHRQPIAAQLGLASADCPAADAASFSVLSIPVHPGLSHDDRAYVAREVNNGLAAA
jgi:perosamine synthetase